LEPPVFFCVSTVIVLPHLEHGIVPSTVAFAMIFASCGKDFRSIRDARLVHKPLLTAGTSLAFVAMTATPPPITMATLEKDFSRFVGV
jgi:hypothetical protein